MRVKTSSDMLRQYTELSYPQMSSCISSIYNDYIKPYNCVFLLLEGELGTGKTYFVTKLAEVMGMEVDVKVTSPSFNLLNIYADKKQYIYHYDLYRLSSSDDLANLDFAERWLDCPSSTGELRQIHAIEWPNIAYGVLAQLAKQAKNQQQLVMYKIKLSYKLEGMELNDIANSTRNLSITSFD